jgi:hypothetical protein
LSTGLAAPFGGHAGIQRTFPFCIQRGTISNVSDLLIFIGDDFELNRIGNDCSGPNILN